MGIRVEHGPSMVPVGRMAYRTGQNEYINRRRKELEALAEQRANRQQKSQMQINDINAGFQQIQMQHQQGMQRAAAQNQFQLDRDQKNHDWGVKAAADLFNNQKALNDQRHEQGLARVEFGQDLQNQAMIDNNHAQEMTETFDKLYATCNQAGRGLMDDFGATQLKLRGHVKEGRITQEQYDAQYSEGMSELMRTLTGKNSELYQIGAEHQVGGEKIMWGGAMTRTVGEGGVLIFENRYETDPVTGEQEGEEEWGKRWESVQYDGPDDKIGFHYEHGSDGTRKRVSHLPEWQATQNAMRDAAKIIAEQRKTAAAGTPEPLTKADALARYKEEGDLYDTLNPEPLREDAAGNQNPEWAQWQADRKNTIESNLSNEERALFGLPPQGWNEAPQGPRLGGDDLLPVNRPHESSQWIEPQPELQLGNEGFEEFQNIQAPNSNEGAAFDNKLNFLNSMQPQMMQ